MGLKVTFSSNTFAKGTEVAVGDYFLAKVGEPVIVSDEAVDRFKKTTGDDMKTSLGKAFTVEDATKAEMDSAFPDEASTPSVVVNIIAPNPNVVVPNPTANEGGDN